MNGNRTGPPASADAIKAMLDRYGRRIDGLMARFLPEASDPYLGEPIWHHMGGGGKRILLGRVTGGGLEFFLFNETVDRPGELKQGRDRAGGVEVVVHRLRESGGVLLARGCKCPRSDAPAA